MGDSEVPEVNNYLGDGEELNEERRNQFHVNANEILPKLAIVTQEDLGIQDGGEDESFYKRVYSPRNGHFLQFAFDAKTRKFVAEHHLGEVLNPAVGEMVALAEAVRSDFRARNINLEVRRFLHPHILQPLYFIGPNLDLNQVTSILYEDAPLGSLEKYIKRDENEVDDITALQWAYQLADALDYCHNELQILHRAIHPKSVFVFEDAVSGKITVKLGGFIFARLPNKDPITANANPELFFSAPETLNEYNLVCYDFSSDVWSFGMVVDFIAHQGRQPYPDRLRNRKTLKKALLKTEENPVPTRPELRDDLHFDLRMLIECCLQSEVRDGQGNIEPIQPIRPTARQIKQHLESRGYYQ